ncbi:glycosyltransferase family 4 protein [Acinetobacter larvae]|uniref:Glycosyl transferase n=1 Tax=Acinetobacter larvae TaxID=1789224 RepID=A0A1B2M294_9GAMM|nr:glycosyltransferase family 1 protein [Acinetobacter larvae]AOA59308.1 glycosyl transferase [Acinetobacter larvae]
MTHQYAQPFFEKAHHFRSPTPLYLTKNTSSLAAMTALDVQTLTRPRLKIAIVTETWTPEINGVAMTLLQLCQGLQRQGHQILLIRPQQKQSCHRFVPNRECLVKAQTIPRYSGLQFGWPQYQKVATALKHFNADVVHIVTEGPLGLAALYAAKHLQIAISSGFHSPFQDFSRFFDLAFLMKPIQHYLRWFHNQTQLTCVPSRDTEQALLAFGVYCPMVLIGRGVDTQRFSPQYRSQQCRAAWGVDAATTVLLYVGRLSPEKQVDQLIAHYLQLRDQRKDFCMVVVGDGPDLARLQALAQGQVIFTGALRDQALATAYASADVFVFASQVETFGNVVLEAMASALPVVAYDYACAQQYVQQGRSGWRIPLKQSQAFQRCLLQLPDLTQLREMGQYAAQRVQNVGWQHVVQDFERALYQVKYAYQMQLQ